MKGPRLALFLALLLLGAMPARTMRAQTSSAATAKFEAASIRRNTSGETRIRFETPPGRLTAVNIPLRFAIRQAYRVPEARIIGGPSWLDTDRFDILATAGGEATSEAIRSMLRALLADRFGLALRSEERDMPIYSLTVAKAARDLGPNLRRSTTDCTGKGSSLAGGRVQCGILVSQGPGSASLRGGAATMESFARLLGDFLDRPLIDATDLAGTFDLELQFTAQRSATPGAAVPGGLAPATNPDDVPTIFTALPEQLGLKLEARRGRASVYVVDSASPPSVD
jgi:uncharacterized protein (TIGR03435 family)